MEKRGLLTLFILVSVVFSFGLIVAAEEPTLFDDSGDEEFVTDWDGNCGDFDCDELELRSGGITPDSAFYFLDEFLDRFGSDLENREEKIAELKAMIEAGKYEDAREAMRKYHIYAENLEKEVSPEELEDATKSSITIEKTLRELENEIPDEYKTDFVDGVIEREGNIRTSAEISSKIKELCEQLAGLDPLEYSKMCSASDDDPKWKKKLDKDLTEEQEKIAREFVSIMKECFQTSGEDCACEEIPFYDFSVACSKAAPLAMACDIDGDEVACDELDNLEMPELPEWLEPIWKDLEDGMMEAQYDMHMPRECIEEGATTPKECSRIMIKIHAPLECKAALLEADVSSESEGREICDKIMMEQHSPQCAENGITDPEECAHFMDSFRGDDGRRSDSGFGQDCGMIEDPMQRLDCYDNRGNEIGDHYGLDERFDGNQGEITWQCKENRIHWGPDCETFMREEWPEQERQRMEDGDMRMQEEGDWRIKEQECASSCDLQNGWWDFRNGECECYTTDDHNYPTAPEGEWDGGDDWQGGSGDGVYGGDGTSCGEGHEEDGQGGCIPFGTGDYGFEDDGSQYGPGEGPGEPEDYAGEAPSEEPPPQDEPAPEPESDPVITGEVFLEYYFN